MLIEDWVFASIMTVLLSYQLRFSEATLILGRELSDTDSATGFQDAVTPPWQTKFGFFAFGGTLFAIVGIWLDLGWLSGLGAIALVLFGSTLVRSFLPKPDAAHFRNLILKSMVSRHANYVRDGDTERASAMHGLLVRAGLRADEAIEAQIQPLQALHDSPGEALRESSTGETLEETGSQNPNKREPRTVIRDRANVLRAEMGFDPTNDPSELGSIFLTKTTMDVLQSEGAMVHPESMALKEAGLGFAFTCFMAVPVMTVLEDAEINKEPNRFLVLVASSVFQFFDENSQIAIFTLGVEIFQKATSSGGDSDAFKEFTDQIHKLVLGYALTGEPEIMDALRNRFQAFRNLITN